MKTFKYLCVLVFFSLLTFAAFTSNAQCSMCTLNAESSVKNGQTEGKGLNKAIMFLLAAPYVAVAGIGYLWYKKYRRKNIPIDMKDEKIHLN
ncbi:MAG: hypothetical protein K0S09_1228 [Sphingobacteriaceae bacterium]|jgi:SNF family Na+-dependent transporter|nr:hypothetical protein [Sphingobacteriaceae bacterium]